LFGVSCGTLAAITNDKARTRLQPRSRITGSYDKSELLRMFVALADTLARTHRCASVVHALVRKHSRP